MQKPGYWETHYQEGGDSGTTDEGSRITRKVFERNQIPLDDVLDLGCGDMRMWAGARFGKYTGIDGSGEIVSQNRARFAGKDEYRFICSDITDPVTERARVVTCLNVLFHLRDDHAYLGAIENMTRCSQEWIVVLTWRRNPLTSLPVRARSAGTLVQEGRWGDALDVLTIRDLDDDRVYQRYRQFHDVHCYFEKNGFRLVSVEPTGEYGAFYIFRRMGQGVMNS